MRSSIDPRKTWWLWRETQKRLVQWGHALLQGRDYTIQLSPEGTSLNDTLNHIIQVNPQMFPTLDAGKQFRLTQGLLAHEVGHALFSDAWPDQEDNLLCEMTNILEDSRIEKALCVYYPGIVPVIEQLDDRMLKNIPPKLCTDQPDEMQAYTCCLIWRWACGRMEETKMLDRLHITTEARILWSKVRPLVEEAWTAANTREVIDIARKVLRILDLKLEKSPSRMPGMSTNIPRAKSMSAHSFPSGPAETQPGLGLDSKMDTPMEQDHFSQPKPYIDLENQAAPYARQLTDSLKVPTPDVHLVPHEYAGRFNIRQDLRSPETPNLARRSMGDSARSLALYVLVDRSGSMCEVDADVRLALMTIYLAATSLEIPIGIAYFGAADHLESTDRVFELTPLASFVQEDVKALIAGFEGVTGAEFLNWALDLAKKRLFSRSERDQVLIIIHDGKPVYKGEDGDDWELSRARIRHLENLLITTIGVYLGTNSEDHYQLNILFPRLITTSGKALPEKLGALLRSLAR
jgi:hypothetical protein